MFMNFLTDIVDKFLGFVMDLINKIIVYIKLDVFIEKFRSLINMIKLANTIFPVAETISVLVILCTFAYFCFIFWCVQKLYEMIRG